MSNDAVRQVFSWADVVAGLRAAYSTPHGEANSPRRSMARAADGIWLRSQAAAPEGSRYMGAKLFGFGRDREVNYPIVLFEQQSGRLAAIVDGALVTAFRTAATSALAVDRLAGSGPLRLAVLGSGLEARHHVEAIAAVRPIASLAVSSPTPANRESFAREFGSALGIPARAMEDPGAAVRDADVVVAAARSFDESPILKGEWLAAGQVVVSIGSTLPEQREVDSGVVAAADLIVCDMVDEVVEETGDMLAARAAGVELADKIISLNEAMQPAAASRVESARLPLYKSVGSGLQDIVVAGLALDRALEAGLAVPSGVDLFTRYAKLPAMPGPEIVETP